MDLQTFRSLTGQGGDLPKTEAAPRYVVGMGARDQSAMTVSALNQYIHTLIASDTALSDLTVRGEISNFVAHRSGHCYFSLKDEGGLVRAVMFRTAASRLAFRPESGMKVLVHGYVSVYDKDGQYQLYVSAMEPDGIGSLYLAFEERKRRLAAEGLFDASRKRPIPRYPARIGVITSPTGAAIRDILHILARRYPCAEVLLYPALVQGEEAARSMIAGLRWFQEQNAADVLIIGRGGGSFEDLFAFQDEGLAREIAASTIPVISAVGHETDFSISDFVADLRAPTPSAAAELAVPDMTELLARTEQLRARMRTGLSATVSRGAERLAQLSARPVLRRADRFFDAQKTALLRQTEHVFSALRRILSDGDARLAEMGGKLDALSPLAVLSRGYAAAFHADGRAVTSVHHLSTGDRLSLRLADGSASVRVEDLHDEDQEHKEKGEES